MKKILIVFMVILLTGCQTNNIVTCFLDVNNDDSLEKAVMSGIFENEKLIEIRNIGFINYFKNSNAEYIYNYLQDSFNNINYNGFDNDLYIKDKTVYYKLNYKINNMNKDDIKSSLGSLQTNYKSFIKYAEDKGYNCN